MREVKIIFVYIGIDQPEIFKNKVNHGNISPLNHNFVQEIILSCSCIIECWIGIPFVYIRCSI